MFNSNDSRHTPPYSRSISGPPIDSDSFHNYPPNLPPAFYPNSSQISLGPPHTHSSNMISSHHPSILPNSYLNPSESLDSEFSLRSRFNKTNTFGSINPNQNGATIPGGVYSLNPGCFQNDESVDVSPSRSTLWMGELEPWMDEGALRQIWSSVGYQVTPKVIQHRNTGQAAGYGFIEFARPVDAQRALSTLQGAPLPGTRKVFRLNWALGNDSVSTTNVSSNLTNHMRPNFSSNPVSNLGPGFSNPGFSSVSGAMNSPGVFRDNGLPEYSIFVGDLADHVDDVALLSLFRHYPSARAAKVVLDAGTGRHRGYGFVRFGSEIDRARALAEMPGTLLQGRPVRVSLATPRARSGTTPSTPAENRALVSLGVGYVDPSITTVFVGNLDANAGEEDLRKVLLSYFQAFGEIDHIKIPPGKGCGFVQYAHRHQAECALAQLNGVQIGANRVRLSWGRLPAERTPGRSRMSSQPPSDVSQFPMYNEPMRHPSMPNVGALSLHSSQLSQPGPLFNRTVDSRTWLNESASPFTAPPEPSVRFGSRPGSPSA